MIYKGRASLPGTSVPTPVPASIREPIVIRSRAIRLMRSRAAWPAIGAIAAWAVAVAAVWSLERATLWRDRGKAVGSGAGGGAFTFRIDIPGLVRPPAVPAAEAGLGDDEEVIGVVVDGRPRAYRLRALEYPPWHVVNDVIGGVPITVAHCDLSGCTRTYAGEPGSGPLDVAQGGLVAGEMVVKVGGVPYVHRTGRPLDPATGGANAPYPGHPWERTTWRAWSVRHPETDVFVAGPGPRRD